MTGGPATHLTATILGCGSSGGVPRVGNIWGACDPAEPKNRRRRCALLVEGSTDGVEGTTRVLIDTGPDLREQLLDARVPHIDGVFYTHEHADHTHGIDDLRVLALNARQRVDVYMSLTTETRLREAFGYCFTAPKGSDYPPILNAHSIGDGETTVIEGAGGTIAVSAFEQEHGSITSLGFRIGRLAYSCDLSGIPERSFWALEGLETWILDALRYTPHPSHLHLAQSLELIARHRPTRSILTNLHVDMDYATLVNELAEGISPAFDGLQFPVSL